MREASRQDLDSQGIGKSLKLAAADPAGREGWKEKVYVGEMGLWPHS